MDSHLAFTQKVNLHASSMFVGLCPTLVLKADATPAAFIVIPVAIWSSYLWLKHFRLRRRYRISTVRTGREMFRNALDEGWRSHLLSLPLSVSLILLLAYFTGGMQWVWNTTPSAILFALMVGIAERYPLSEYA